MRVYGVWGYMGVYGILWINISMSQNFEQRNVEQSTFQNLKIVNIKIVKDELFCSFLIEFTFFIFYKVFEQPKYLIIS